MLRMELLLGSKKYELRQRGLEFEVVDPTNVGAVTRLTRYYANGWCETTVMDLRHWLTSHGFTIVSENDA
jgi:hypothetical protein